VRPMQQPRILEWIDCPVDTHRWRGVKSANHREA